MRENIYAFVMATFDSKLVPLARVSRETGIPYESLKKIAHRRTPNPGVKHVQKLADYFDQFTCTSPSISSKSATETVAHVDPSGMVEMLAGQRDRARDRVAKDPSDRMAAMILKNRNDALDELAPALANTAQSATETVAHGV